MVQNNINILNWYDSIDKQNHRKEWAFNRVYCLTTEPDYLPPFQLVRDQTGAAISELKLIPMSDETTEFDILANATATGLEIATFPADGYDLIIYPSVIGLSLPTSIGKGQYYLKMSDGSNIWYSEIFILSDNESDLIKIEYWHGEDFVHQTGHIRYNYPYKNKLYLSGDISQPSYEYKEEIIERDGHNFPVQQISFKKYTFNCLMAEFLIDAFRLIRLHDFVEITYKNEVYDVDEFLMQNPEWQKNAVAAVTVEFITDTVVIVNGRGLTSLTYEPGLGGCTLTDRVAVALLVEGSAEYIGFYYNDGGQVPLQTDDIIIKQETGGNLVAEQYNGTNYTALSTTTAATIYATRENEYYVFYGATYGKPLIDGLNSIDGQLYVYGRTFPNTKVDVYIENTGGDQILAGSGTSTDFENTAVGISFTYTDNYNRIRVKATSISCNGFEESENYYLFAGIGSGQIGSTFAVGT